MRDFEHQIMNGGATTSAFEDYAHDRISELTRICINTEASLEQIRVAQAGIQELELIVGLRERLKLQWESTNEPA